MSLSSACATRGDIMARTKLIQRTDGRYRVKYQGKQFYGKTQKEAFQKRDEYKRLIESGAKADSIGLTVAAYSARWVKTYKHHLQDASYDTHVRNLRKFCAYDSYGLRPMRSIDTIDIQEFINADCDEKSKSYINDMRDTIRGLFRGAMADRVIQYNPAVAVTMPEGTSGTHRAITEEERNLINETQHKFRPAVMVMLYAGLRRGEILALDIDKDVDFERKTICVHEAVRFEKQHRPRIVNTKTKAGERIVPLLDVLANELRGLHGLVARNADGEIMTYSALRSAWSSYLSALAETKYGDCKRWYGRRKCDKDKNLPPWEDVDILMHDLRHTYCTMLYDAGIDIKTAQKWMGHKDPTVTLKIYTHISKMREETATKALEMLSQSLSGVQDGVQTGAARQESVELQGFANQLL